MKLLFDIKSLTLTLFLILTISACNESTESKSADSKTPDNAPALGTDIKDVVKNTSGETTGEVKKIMWDDLVAKGFEPELIIKKYEDQINNMPEGGKGAQALLDKVMAEFNNAPPNKELDGIKVKIPGFVSPLDEKDGMVNEFLLVPYFGSCIHSPPPPINQTVLVTPKKGKSIPIEEIYLPVWVTGKVKVEKQKTELAEAGYVIQDAVLEIYDPEKEKANQAQ